MRSRYVVRVLLLFLTLFSCQKGDIQNSTPNPDPPPKPASAKIILPEGSVLHNKELSVRNGKSELLIVENEFNIDTAAVLNTYSFVTDSDDKPYLLKYYDGISGNLEISARSTALALIMSAPIAGSLTEEGRQSLVEYITNTSEFATLEKEIEKSLVQGRPITDSSNTEMRNALLLAFNKMAVVGTIADTTSALTIEKKLGGITIKNNGAANTYVAGIYKNGNRTGDLKIIHGTPRYAMSVDQAANGAYLPSADEDHTDLALTENGQYEIRIRSGNTTTGDNSDENILAAKINMVDVAWTFVQKFLPSNGDCVNDAKAEITNNYQIDIPVMNGSLVEVSNASFQIAHKIINDNINKLDNCYDQNGVFSRYSQTVKMFTGYMASVSGNASGPINVSPRLAHMYYKQQYDLCVTVENAAVNDCGTMSGDTSVYYGFHAVPGTSIGAPIEFRLQFSGSRVVGTATSTSFDYGSGEQTVPVTGTLDGNVMTLLIHADNGIIPEMVDCIPQPAPQCATCRYTGDHVVQDWEIVGIVNDDHSLYSAEYTRKFTFTSLVMNNDCSTKTVVDEVEENGALSY
jgi:hypothetical protein